MSGRKQGEALPRREVGRGRSAVRYPSRELEALGTVRGGAESDILGTGPRPGMEGGQEESTADMGEGSVWKQAEHLAKAGPAARAEPRCAYRPAARPSLNWCMGQPGPRGAKTFPLESEDS